MKNRVCDPIEDLKQSIQKRSDKLIEEICKSDINSLTKLNLLSNDLQSKLNMGLSIDDILDKEDPFEALEPILPQEVYPILVLAMINNIRSHTVMDAILTGLLRGKETYQESKH